MTVAICLFHTRSLLAQNDLELVLLGGKDLELLCLILSAALPLVFIFEVWKSDPWPHAG